MKGEDLIKIIEKSSLYGEFSASTSQTLMLEGVSGSLYSVLLALESQRTGGLILAVMDNRDSASYLYNDLYNILEAYSSQDRVMLLPTAYRRAISTEREDAGGIVQRTATLSAISGSDPLIVCTWGEALAEKVVSRERLDENRLTISVSQRLDKEFVEEVLEDYNFTRVEFVSAPGEYASRGGILDVFSFAGSTPYRIDFLGDEVDSIRSFSVSTQLSQTSVTELSIIPNLKNRQMAGKRVSLAEFINSARGEKHDATKSDNTQPKNSLSVWFQSAGQSFSTIEMLAQKLPPEQVTSPADFSEQTASWRYITLRSDAPARPSQSSFNFGSSPQPSFSRNFELFAANVQDNYNKGMQPLLLTPNIEQWERVQNIFKQTSSRDTPAPPVRNVPLTLHEGFISPLLKIAAYTDHQLFERYHRYRIKSEIEKSEGMTLAEFSALKVGDYVVHIDHGVGIFGGLSRQRDENSGAIKEFIKLTYRDGDVIFVGVQNLHRVSKFKSKDGVGDAPKLQKLGSSTWQRLKETTKRKVKDIARELIRLYAQRKISEGFAFSPDSYLQQELEASFIYEDTPDQRTVTDAIKGDMESREPMDRLVCGDVGFGKTEIAIRAAFKAATDGKQVAVLVPTTVLSLQHYRTFSRRLKEFPVRIENFSRVNSAKQTSEISEALEQGKVDIIIGTHKLLGKSVKFHDLGLLIIDEEQKFGVSVKEKLKELKHSVDTLTLTATPIPRTMQFSLMGARDMSIINTPPPNRRPISTELHVYNEELIKEAIEYELARSGQVFFVHNRVQTIGRVGQVIEHLVPGAKVGIAHGQMSPKELEAVMMDFIYGEYNVLVATTIIESGIDIPGANTIIINNAQNFGLSDLHQLRGRVGRTNRKAYCYLMIPSFEAITTDAGRRLRAIEEFSDLGSGFNIAMQDLDIRGAGNILGAEQSGFMSDIGFETYQRIVAEAMHELHEEMDITAHSDPKLDTTTSKAHAQGLKLIDCTVETDTSAHLPDSYIGSISEKLRLYRALDEIRDQRTLDDFTDKLHDRFGAPPTETLELLQIVKLRWAASALGFDKVILKGSRAMLYFAYNAQSAYYSGSTFAKLMSYVSRHPQQFRLKEGAKLTLEFKGLKGIAPLTKVLEEIAAAE